MSHTKGEWEIMPYTRRDGDNIRWVKAVRGKRHIPICTTFSPNAEANARLIAAAPDLLEACLKIQTARDEYRKNGKDFDYEDIDKTLDVAIAIAKAVGE